MFGMLVYSDMSTLREASLVACAPINSLWGQTIANCWSRSQLGMPCTGWFNKPPGICPCLLYTPPVALTDGLLCEFEGLALYASAFCAMET